MVGEWLTDEGMMFWGLVEGGDEKRTVDAESEEDGEEGSGGTGAKLVLCVVEDREEGAGTARFLVGVEEE